LFEVDIVQEGGFVCRRNGSLAWSEVRGQKFEPLEARHASDFCDLIRNYFIEPDYLVEFVEEQQLTVGHRLYLAENVPLEHLGKILMNETDPRLRAIAQERCREEVVGDRKIILPWE
jgi:hypothetical protein